MPEIKKDIEEAKDKIEEKGADSQTEKDRVDESVAEQIKDDGDEDSQDAKDRVDESEGEEKAEEEKKDDSDAEEHDDASEKKDEGNSIKDIIREAIAEVIGVEIKKAFAEMSKPDKSEKNATPVTKENGLSLEAAIRKYTT